MVECVEVVGQRYVRVEWIRDTGEGSVYGILDYRRVDGEPVHVVKGQLTQDSRSCAIYSEDSKKILV